MPINDAGHSSENVSKYCAFDVTNCAILRNFDRFCQTANTAADRECATRISTNAASKPGKH